MSMTGVRKAAIMMVQFGKEQSAQIMASMSEKEVEMISAEIARLGKLDPMSVDDVMDEFYAMATTRYAGSGGKGATLQRRTDLTPSGLFTVISNGRKRGALVMPPWKSTLSEDEIWELAAYILSLRTMPEQKP